MRVLLMAYSCEPGRGSEPESGWNWATRLAQYYEVYVITHPHNRVGVNRALANACNPRLHVEFAKLPRWLDAWGAGGDPSGIALIFNYMLWQVSSYLVARRLLRRLKFDVVHHVTW